MVRRTPYAQHGSSRNRKPIDKNLENIAMGRRSSSTVAVAAGTGAGARAPNIISQAAASAKSEILARDQDLKFFGIEETYSTEELMTLNAINDEHKQFLEETGLADLGPGRIAAMDDAGLNVAILSA